MQYNLVVVGVMCVCVVESGRTNSCLNSHTDVEFGINLARYEGARAHNGSCGFIINVNN